MAQYGNMTLRERESKLRRRIEELGQESSDANQRDIKRSRKLNPLPKKLEKNARAKYDERGFDKETGLDICDCLEEGCPGCWMNCHICGSRKCGHECRRYRRFRYDYVEVEGTEFVIRNKK